MISTGTRLIFVAFIIAIRLHHLCAQCCKDDDLRVLSAASWPKAFIIWSLLSERQTKPGTEDEKNKNIAFSAKSCVNKNWTSITCLLILCSFTFLDNEWDFIKASSQSLFLLQSLVIFFSWRGADKLNLCVFEITTLSFNWRGHFL